MKPTLLFFDLDDTLYPPTSGVWQAIRARIEQYMRERMGIPPAQISAMRQEFMLAYGTTLRGLQATYKIDAQEYLDFVHDVPLAQFIAPSPALAALLGRYPQRKVIFTNADTAHARRVLKVLQLSEHFEQIIDVRDISPYCKPMPPAFEIALRLAGSPDPQTCALIDDSFANICAAHQLGWQTVLVNARRDPELAACGPQIDHLLELPSVLPVEAP